MSCGCPRPERYRTSLPPGRLFWLPWFGLRAHPMQGRSVPRFFGRRCPQYGHGILSPATVRAGWLAHLCTPPSYLPKVTSRTEFVKQTEFKITIADRHALMDLRRDTPKTFGIRTHQARSLGYLWLRRNYAGLFVVTCVFFFGSYSLRKRLVPDLIITRNS